jgi:hypothetical protein
MSVLRMLAWRLGLVSVAGSLAANPDHMARQATGIRWYAELAPDPGYVVVYVDARQMHTNDRLSNVTYTLEFFDTRGNRIAQKRFPFTDAQHPVLGARAVYQRMDPHQQKNIASVKGVSLDWAGNSAGDKADTPPIRQAATRPFALPTEIRRLAAAVPAPQILRSGALAGDWRYRMHSQMSNEIREGNAYFDVHGQRIVGSIEVRDSTRPLVTEGPRRYADSLDLERVTGLGTTQRYRVALRGGMLIGRFWNEGRYSDSGSIVFRAKPVPTPAARP